MLLSCLVLTLTLAVLLETISLRERFQSSSSAAEQAGEIVSKVLQKEIVSKILQKEIVSKVLQKEIVSKVLQKEIVSKVLQKEIVSKILQSSGDGGTWECRLAYVSVFR